MHLANHAGVWLGLGSNGGVIIVGMTSHCTETHRWTLTYLGDGWRWESEPYGKFVNVDWAWRELKDAGEELPEAVKSEDGDSGLQSQELWAGDRVRVPNSAASGGRGGRGPYQGGRYGSHGVRVDIQSQTQHGGGQTWMEKEADKQAERRGFLSVAQMEEFLLIGGQCKSVKTLIKISLYVKILIQPS